MLLVCNSQVDADRNSNSSDLELTAGRTYTCIATVFGEGDRGDYLVIGDQGVARWVPSTYLDTYENGSVWHFSADWGVLSERSDSGSAWWRFAIARRELIPHLEILLDGLRLSDPPRARIISHAVYQETARDNLIYSLACLVKRETTSLEISQWALKQLDSETPMSRHYSDDQVVILAELSNLEQDSDDIAKLAEEMLGRL